LFTRRGQHSEGSKNSMLGKTPGRPIIGERRRGGFCFKWGVKEEIVGLWNTGWGLAGQSSNGSGGSSGTTRKKKQKLLKKKQNSLGGRNYLWWIIETPQWHHMGGKVRSSTWFGRKRCKELGITKVDENTGRPSSQGCSRVKEKNLVDAAHLEDSEKGRLLTSIWGGKAKSHFRKGRVDSERFKKKRGTSRLQHWKEGMPWQEEGNFAKCI